MKFTLFSWYRSLRWSLRRWRRAWMSFFREDTVIHLDLHEDWAPHVVHDFLAHAVEEKPWLKRLPYAWIKRTAFLFGILFLVNNSPAYYQYFKQGVVGVQEQGWSSVELASIEGDILSSEIPLLDFPIVHYENRIKIPSLGIDAPIVLPTLSAEALKGGDWGEIEKKIHDSLAQGVVHYPGTAKPFEQGNFFLTGHSSNVLWEYSEYNTVFARLPKIAVGDQIIVDYEQKRYVYEVSSTKEVTPQTVEVLSQEGEQRLSLMTCTPVGTTLKRFIVEAKPVKVDPID